MLQFKNNDTAANIILTLTENVTINDVYYLFVCRHELTKQIVSFILYEGQDESTSQNRYNQFTINAAALFNGKPTGEWHYTVYQQDNNTNTDTSLTSGVIEYGKLILDKAVDFEFKKYEQPTSYTAYNG